VSRVAIGARAWYHRRVMASKALILGLVATVAGGALVYWIATTRISPDQAAQAAQTVAGTKAGQAAAEAVMTDEERRAYIQAHVVAEGVEVGVDTKEEEGKTIPIPGLLRVRGQVLNKGDRGVTPITLQVLLLDKQDKVLGAYLEDVSGGKRLEPGASRAFTFQLPDNREWGGTFKHAFK
jgi:hypothetical protein